MPYANHASSSPVTAPDLANPKNIGFHVPREDYFSSTTLKYAWFFWNKTNATKYSLSDNPGYLRLKPGTATTHILQQEAGRAYTMTTKVTVNATANGQRAGLRIQNGNDDLSVNMYAGYNGSAKIGFAYGTTVTEVNNSIGSTVWLRIDRDGHNIKGFYSADGKTWTQVGSTASATALDDASTNYNEWVGNAVGLYATNITADFDFYKFRDASAPVLASGHNNFNGVTTSSTVTNSTNGGWITLAGVSMGTETAAATQIIVNAASAAGTGSLEVWTGNINGAGTKIATIPITASGGATTLKDYTASVNVIGQHDLYFKFAGASGAIVLNSVRFGIDAGAPSVSISAPANNTVLGINKQTTISATATDSDGTIAKVEFFEGTTPIGSATASPFSVTWKATAAGTYSITAKATDNSGKTAVSNAISIIVKAPQAPYGGTAWAIPGKIEFENYDEGGQDSAYKDNTVGSETGVAFRTTEDVDIETCTDAGAGYNIGYATAGEWLEYTVNVAFTGTYDLALRVACNADSRTLSISSNGTSIAADVAIPNTAGWQTWTDVLVKDIKLTAGVQVIRVTMGASDYVNMNYMTFTSKAVPPVVTITAPADASSFSADQTVSLKATATSTASTIKSIAFYDGTLLLATLTTAPYTFDWTGASVGKHTIYAEATDKDGVAAKTSIVVDITKAASTIPLKKGWNMVGYPFVDKAAIATALSSVWANVLVVKDADAFYDKSQSAALNLLQSLEYSKGYYVKVDKDCVLDWLAK